MWEDGYFKIDGIELKYHAKVYDEGSKFGINGGRISKLMVNYCREGDDVWELDDAIIFYDRGWLVKPTTKFGEKALKHLLKLYK